MRASFAFDLQAVRPDIDLQTIGLLLRLIEIVAEDDDSDDQDTNDQIEDVSVVGHSTPFRTHEGAHATV